MTHGNAQAYGLWSLVLVNVGVVLVFAFSFFTPKSKLDWRAFGAFSAFIVALFTEMYGFPLTIFLLSGWLQKRLPGINLYGHETGHLWWSLTGGGGNPHLNPIHLTANIAVFGGFWLLATAWPVLYKAQKENRLATEGPYARIRHPQYLAFAIIMAGFFFMWPTLPTLIMLPVLLAVYARLAVREEHETASRFPQEWVVYAARTPAFLPRFVKSNANGDGKGTTDQTH